MQPHEESWDPVVKGEVMDAVYREARKAVAKERLSASEVDALGAAADHAVYITWRDGMSREDWIEAASDKLVLPL